MKLKDKVAIVTGAAGGIGQVFSLALAQSGAKVVAADLQSCNSTINKIKEIGGEAIEVLADVTQSDSAEKMAKAAIDAFGAIDIHINNAGILPDMKPFDSISESEWDLVMNVNVKGMWNCAKAVIPYMKEKGKGKIINISSTTFFEGVPMTVHYVASKGAVIGLSRSLSRELTNTGINVNVIAPGLTLTKTTEGQMDSTVLDKVREKVNSSRIIQRDQRPDDLVGALLFLASDDSDFITGQTIAVDGGTSHL